MNVVLIAYLPIEQRRLNCFASNDFCLPSIKTFSESIRKSPNGQNSKNPERKHLAESCGCNSLYSLHESLSQLPYDKVVAISDFAVHGKKKKRQTKHPFINRLKYFLNCISIDATPYLRLLKVSCSCILHPEY